MNKIEQAKIIFDYLYRRDELEKADVIIGFGHFDMKIPKHCVELYFQKHAPKIILAVALGQVQQISRSLRLMLLKKKH